MQIFLSGMILEKYFNPGLGIERELFAKERKAS